MNPVLVEVWRGPALESRHRGRVAVVDATGRAVLNWGDTDEPVFPRSAVKLLQALPLVASGAAEHYGLTDEQLALACASHGGEPAHVATAAGLLRRLGLDDTALECGTHWPSHEASSRALAASGASPGALHNNCSGKHSGFLCLGCHTGRAEAGWLSGYVNPEHAVMREVSAALAATTGCRLDTAPRGIDGCSIPTFAVPLKNLALAFARVAAEQGLSPEHARAARRLRHAVARAPFMVAGTGRFDTRVMQRLGERVCCKVGAEGVYCSALPELGLGLALKMDDGNNARAAEVALAALLLKLLPLDGEDRVLLDSLARPVLRNWRGTEVGRLVPTLS